MRIPGGGRLRLAAGKLQNRLSPGMVILLYHRVADLQTDPQLLCVSPSHFEQHLQVLTKLTNSLSLKSLTQSLKEGGVTRHGTVVTFDDGAADNLYNAKPLLQRYEIPATVFVATEYAKGHREFWWDELERILLTPGELPESLTLAMNGRTLDWELGPSTSFSAESSAHRSWNVLERNTPTARHDLYRLLLDLLRSLTTPQRFEVIAKLQEWSGKGTIPRETHRALTPDEIHKLADGGIVEVGAHTVTHPLLSTISLAEQEQEIKQSKFDLENVLNQSITSFAYPYGTKDDYKPETVKIVKQANFACACSNFRGVVQPGTNLYELPRFVVRNWDGDEFERRLRGWFRG